jgi:uncharacterized membrane protein YccC
MNRRPLASLIDQRHVDSLECVASVLLAIAFAHLLEARNVSWAAFSGFMVMRGHVAESVTRGLLRIVGTSAGGALGLLIAPYAVRSVVLAALALIVVGLPSLYAAITARRAYAWLFVGLTFVMVMLDKLEDPGITTASYVATRMLEVTAGTAACVIVSTVSAVTLRRVWPAERAPAPPPMTWRPDAFRHAAQAAVAMAFLPVVGALWHVPQLAQGAVTIMAAMLIPVAGIGASGLKPVSLRLAYRVAGCLAGAAFGAAFLFAAAGSAPLLILGTMVGVAIGRMIENAAWSFTYVGTQFVLAVLVVLVPDDYAAATIGPGLSRLAGILVGMALLEPVLLAGHVVRSRGARKAEAVRSEAGGV